MEALSALLATVPLDVVIFVAVFAVLAAAVVRQAKPQRRWQARPRYGTKPRTNHAPQPTATRDPTDAAEQLRAVMASTFTAKRVLSRTEAQVMAATEAAIADAGLPWRVLAQVSLGEVLDSPDRLAFNAINAKRVDLLIVSALSDPLAAIEYQGQGHWQGNAPARDAVKKEALRKAGVRYIEITPDHKPADLHREIARLAAAFPAHSGAKRGHAVARAEPPSRA